jgi:hypothetical protein
MRRKVIQICEDVGNILGIKPFVQDVEYSVVGTN